MIEYPEEPDLNFNLLFDGLPIIQRYLRHLSHKDKDHLEVGCKPNRPKSVFWSEFLGTRRYTPYFFLSCTFSSQEPIYKKLGPARPVQNYIEIIGDLYLIMVCKRPKVTLNDRIRQFGTHIRNQGTKLYQNNEKKICDDLHPILKPQTKNDD